MTQPDIHPDADALNAFAEHALPDAERARMVAHMAGCARCREVVYLAQIAADAEGATVGAASGSGAKAEPGRGWFGSALAKWRIALIPAAALAATGAVMLWVQLRPAPLRSEMAKMTPPQTAPAPAHTADRVVAPGPLPIPGAPAALRSVRPEPKQARPASGAIGVPGIASMDRLARNEAAPAASAPGGARLTGAYHLDGHSASMARRAPSAEPPSVGGELAFEPALTRPEWQQPQMATITPAAKSRARAMKPFPAPPPPNVAALNDTVVASAKGEPQLLNAGALPEVQLAPQPLNGMAVLRLTGRTKLPSGLNTVSSAALLNRLLVVDSAGAVFLSQDAGKHWEAVPAQWSGKAIEVQAPSQGLYRFTASAGPETLEPASFAAPAPQEEKPSNPSPSASVPAPPRPAPDSASPAAKAGAAPPIPAMSFKLVTDRHRIWVSADGKVWREP